MSTHSSDENQHDSLTTPYHAAPGDDVRSQTSEDEVMSRSDMRIDTKGIRCTFDSLQARVADLTGNGMRLTLAPSKLPKVDETHKFTFTDKETQHELTVEGVIRWIRKGSVLTRKAEVGIEFVDLPASHRDALTRLAVQGELLMSNSSDDSESDEQSTPILNINLYDILGVCQYASQDEIRSSFHHLVKLWHPDKNDDPEAPSRFEELHKAYSILRDPSLRSKYDARFGPDQAAA